MSAFRGNAPAKIDDKGRLKVPEDFRRLLESKYGRELFLTSLSGEYVRVYPMPVWLGIEDKLGRMPSSHPSRLRYLDRIAYYGQACELDAQGRILIPVRLRESATMTGEVDVLGHYDYLDVWNHDRLQSKMQRDPYTDDDARALSEFRNLTSHVPVMTAELLRYLGAERGGLFVDCTVGLGGHARALLQAGATRLIGLDRDRDALERARDTLAPWRDRVELVHADYRSIDAVLDERRVERVDGALADLGVSSMQLEAPDRGFSFQRDERLDMRMDQSAGDTAADLIAHATEVELADAIFTYGEERFSRRIARAIVSARREAPIDSTGRLASIVRRAIPRRGFTRIDPATRTFQALRIWVNRELDGLDHFLEIAAGRLRAAARLVVITFHSLEDRIVKHTFRRLERRGGPGGPDEGSAADAPGVAVRVLTKKPLVPTEQEVQQNPRARSAKLRAAERLA